MRSHELKILSSWQVKQRHVTICPKFMSLVRNITTSCCGWAAACTPAATTSGYVPGPLIETLTLLTRAVHDAAGQ